MTNRMYSLILGSLIIAASAMYADAQPCDKMGGPGGMHGKGMMMEGMGPGSMGMMGGMMMDMDHHLWKHITDLGLDEKQKNAIQAVHTKAKKEMIKRKADLQVVHIELKDLLDKDPVDMKSVEALVKKCEAGRTEMFLAHVRAQEEAKALLTPEQKKKLNTVMDTCRDGCRMMHGNDHDENAGHPMHECKH